MSMSLQVIRQLSRSIVTATAVAAGLGSVDFEWLDVEEPVERP